MHEASLVTALLRQVDEVSVAHGSRRVLAVRVEVGLLAGVEPLLLREAFDRLKPTSTTADAELEIEPYGLAFRCRLCHAESTVDRLQFVCPHCDCEDVVVTRGDAVTLISVTMSTVESP